MTDAPWPAPCPPDLNLADYVLSAGRATPDKIALAVLGPSGAERWSHGRLAEAVARAAGGLVAAGLGPGDRLLLRLCNTPVFPIAFLGAIRAGIVPVATAAALTGPEIDKLAALVDPAAVLHDGATALPAMPARRLGPDALHGPPAPVARPGADAPAYIVFTSGTSGKPRAVVHAHRAAWARRSMWQGWYGLGPEDRVLHAGAFNWTYTLGAGLLDPWAIGATALVLAEDTDPGLLPLLLKRHDATMLAAVPGLFRRLLRDAPALDLPRLRHGLSAGERLPQSLRARWREMTGTDLHEALGMSECSTFISGSPDHPAPPGSTGFPQVGRRIALIGEDGVPGAPVGRAGTLAIHRDDPGLMLGYAEGDRIDLPLAGEWFVTGDRVEADAEGAIRYAARVDDLLTTGGYRIAPQEIEGAFEDAPGLTAAAALSLPVSNETEVIALAYCGQAQPEAALADHAAARLAGYKRPRLYIHLDDLPRGANGKLDRRALRTRLEALR